MEFCMVGHKSSDTADIGKRNRSETDGIEEKSGRTAAFYGGAVPADGGIYLCLDGNILSLPGTIWES